MKTFKELVELLEEVGIPSNNKIDDRVFYSYNNSPIIVSLNESKIMISKGDSNNFVVCFYNKNEFMETQRIEENKIESFILTSIVQGKFKEEFYGYDSLQKFDFQ